jgi:Carboxypeptidase regulatory-like domain
MRIKQNVRLMCSSVALLLAFSLSASVQAQDLTGEIDGTVRDSSGAAIPNAEVIIKNADQNLAARMLRTNEQGQFTASLLSLAHYSVTVNATGFQSATKTLDVHTGVNSNASFTLELGSVSQNVNVTTDTVVAAQLDNAAAGTLISSTKMSELSLSSRNFLQLLPIQPGVASAIPGPQDRGSISTAGGVNSASYEVNGIPAQYNGYFLDGQDLQRRSAGGTQIGAYPGIDFIREMNLERSNFGAQYGGSGSASISIASKSGNTDFHGSLYEFYRSQIFNANNYFNNLAGVPIPSLRYSDFGYALGGPMWLPHITNRKNAKTFFFVGQEFLRSKMSVQSTLTNVPTEQQRLGVFNATVCTSYNAAGACVASATSIAAIDPEARAYLTDVIGKIPLPNSPTDPQGLIVSEGGTNNETQTFVRIDRHVNDKFNVFFRFFNDPFNLTVPYGLRQGVQAPGVGTANVTNGDRAYYGSGTYVFSPVNVLQAGGGYLRSYVTAQAVGTLLASNSPDIRPGLPLMNTTGRVPNLAIGGSTYATISPYTNGEPQTQIFANDTQLFGRHTVSGGFNLEWQKAGNNVATTNAGAYTFKATTVPKPPAGMTAASQFDQAFANFLEGSVTSFQQVSPDPSVYLHANLYEAYVQDDFHARPNLILNMGVRYSYIASPSSGTLKGRPYLPFVNFVPSLYTAAGAPTVDTTGLICTKTPCNGGVLPNPAYNSMNGIIVANLNSPFGSKVTDQANLTFAPRFGFSYDVSGKGTTAIRGGYGIYYIQSTTADYGSLGNSNQPNIQNLLISNTNFSNPGSGAVAGNPSPQVLKAAQTNWQSPYVQAYSLDLQRSFGAILADVGYYGNRVLHLPVNQDINQPLPGLYIQKGVIPGGVVNATNTPDLNQIRPYLGYGPINSDIQNGISNYNSLQASVTKRFRDGSLAAVNYTYSRTLSNASAPQNIYNPAAEYGPDGSGRANILNFNYVYVLPFFLKERSVKGYLLGGWEFTGIVSFASGQYLTANTSAVDPAGQGILATGTAEGNDRPDYVSNPNAHAPHSQLQWFNTAAFTAVPAGQYRPGNSSNGSIIGPGYENWDLSLFKNAHFGAERDLQFRFETFNAFNHTNFNAISTVTSATNYGQVTSAGSARVLQLGAKFAF